MAATHIAESIAIRGASKPEERGGLAERLFDAKELLLDAAEDLHKALAFPLEGRDVETDLDLGDCEAALDQAVRRLELARRTAVYFLRGEGQLDAAEFTARGGAGLMALRSVFDPPATSHDVDEYVAAAVVAETLREQAANMPLGSPIRALALRSATRWATIAGTRPISLRLAGEDGD
jgi:hypothetical protein